MNIQQQLVRYTVLVGRASDETLYWMVYDRAARITLSHRPSSADEAWAIARKLNAAGGC